MAVDREIIETIERIVDERIAPLRVSRADHAEVMARFERVETGQARLEDALARLAEAQRRTEEALAHFERKTDERFERVDDRFERVEKEIAASRAASEARFARVEREIAESRAASEARFERVQREIAETRAASNERMDRIIADSNERMDRIDATIAASNERMDRIDATLERVADGQAKLRQEVGAWTDTLGRELEDMGRIVVPHYLRHEEGVDVADLEQRYFRVDGQEVEVDLCGEGRGKDGGPVTVLVECKSKVYARELDAFDRTSERVAASLDRPVVRAVFCHRAHPDAKRRASERGIIIIPWHYQDRIA